MAYIGNAQSFRVEGNVPGNLQVSGNATISGTTNSVGALTENSNSVVNIADTGVVTEAMLSSNYYEEGTWTPAYQGVTVAYTTQTGRYTKVGRLVFLQFYIATSSISMAGDYSGFQITNLPFTSNSSDWNTLGNFTAGLFGYDAFSTASGTQALDGDHNDVAQGCVFGATTMLLTNINGSFLSYNDVGNSGTTHFTGSCMYTTD